LILGSWVQQYSFIALSASIGTSNSVSLKVLVILLVQKPGAFALSFIYCFVLYASFFLFYSYYVAQKAGELEHN